VAISGIRFHPVSHGFICPAGLAAHHLGYHPLRLRQPVMREKSATDASFSPCTAEKAVKAVTEAIRSRQANRLIAILDQQPGRTVSSLYQNFLSGIPGGSYLVAPGVALSTTAVLQTMIPGPSLRASIDLERTRLLLSFGTPVFDGWSHQAQAREAHSAGRLKVVQIESRQSRTAQRADRWFPVRPGTEWAFATGVAHILVRSGNFDRSIASRARDFSGPSGLSYAEFVAQFTPEKVARITGTTPEALRDVAQLVAGNAPALAIADGDAGGGPWSARDLTMINGLNFLLGSVGVPGGFALSIDSANAPLESRSAEWKTLSDLPDHSLSVLMMDSAASGEAIPWSLIQSKLAEDRSLVVSLSPALSGHALHSDFVVPSPFIFESTQDTSGPADSPARMFAVSTPLVTPPKGVIEPSRFVAEIAQALGLNGFDPPPASGYAELLKKRAGQIHASGKGEVIVPATGERKPTSSFASAEDFWSTIAGGAYWLAGNSTARLPGNCSFFGRAGEQIKRLAGQSDAPQDAPPGSEMARPLTLVVSGLRGAVPGLPVSPLLSKLYAESALRENGERAFVHPETGRASGLKDGCRAAVETSMGSTRVHVQFDESVMPGTVHMTAGPMLGNGNAKESEMMSDGILAICAITEGGTWRTSQAAIREV
jgi:anaerobic selenocysteine-containing dehydrogenase